VRASLKTVISDITSLSNLDSEHSSQRTYTTKRGTTSTMRTAKVGKSRPGPPTPSNSTESDYPESENQTSPANLISDKAAPGPAPEQGAVAVARVDELQAENTALRAQVADLQAEVTDLKHDVAELLDENENMGRIIDADDRLKAALAEVARHMALAENAERTLAARSNEFNDRARNVADWKNRAEKGQKLL